MTTPPPISPEKERCYCECHALDNFGWDQKTRTCKHCHSPSVSPEKEPILCYVEGDSAYFTTQSLAEQWGDDWNDAPYEHNAGTPYGLHSQEKWKIFVLKYDWDAEQPSDGCYNSPYSVKQINSGLFPWLRPFEWVKGGQSIYAGTTMSTFCKIIVGSGGKVYREIFEGDELYKIDPHPPSVQAWGLNKHWWVARAMTTYGVSKEVGELIYEEFQSTLEDKWEDVQDLLTQAIKQVREEDASKHIALLRATAAQAIKQERKRLLSEVQKYVELYHKTCLFDQFDNGKFWAYKAMQQFLLTPPTPKKEKHES